MPALLNIQNILALPVNYSLDGFNHVYKFNVSNFNAEENATYYFKREEQVELKYVSVHTVGIRYVNLGIVGLQVGIISPNNPNGVLLTLNLGDSTQTKGYYNGGTVPLANADGNTYNAFYSFHPITDEWFQVFLYRGSLSGPLKISRVTVFGETKEESR